MHIQSKVTTATGVDLTNTQVFTQTALTHTCSLQVDGLKT